MNLVNEPTQGSAAQGLRFMSSPLFLFSNLSLFSKTNFLLISSLARDLPYLAATTGRAAAQPFASDERILQVCRARPFSFLVLCETEHPKP